MDIQKIETKIKYLPPHLKRQVSDYIEFLSKRYDVQTMDYKFNLRQPKNTACQ